jgi:hypothetical protein
MRSAIKALALFERDFRLPTLATHKSAILEHTPLEDFRQGAECLAVPSGAIDKSA